MSASWRSSLQFSSYHPVLDAVDALRRKLTPAHAQRKSNSFLVSPDRLVETRRAASLVAEETR